MLFPSLPALLLKKTEKWKRTESKTLCVDNKLHSRTSNNSTSREAKSVHLQSCVSHIFPIHSFLLPFPRTTLYQPFTHLLTPWLLSVSFFGWVSGSVLCDWFESLSLPNTACGCCCFRWWHKSQSWWEHSLGVSWINVLSSTREGKLNNFLSVGFLNFVIKNMREYDWTNHPALGGQAKKSPPLRKNFFFCQPKVN